MSIARFRYPAVAAILIALLAPTVLTATVITVRKDGTGDYTSVFEAVEAAAPGDTVEVGPGTYSVLILYATHELSLISTHGPDSTVLEPVGNNQVIRYHGSNTTGIIEGFTIRNGSNSGGVGSGLDVREGANVTVRNCIFDNNQENGLAVRGQSTAVVDSCVFRNNYAPSAGGGLYADIGSNVWVYTSVFEFNEAGLGGGGAAALSYARIYFFDCEFYSNVAGSSGGGAVHASSAAAARINRCVFTRNTSTTGAAVFNTGAGYVTTSTITANISAGGAAAVGGSVTRCIIANQVNGFGVSNVSRSCNVYWNNARGAIAHGGVLAPNEIQADPQFCDAPGDDFTIANTSPASAIFSLCGELIGAREVACVLLDYPVIEVFPDTLKIEMWQDDISQSDVTIRNHGGGELHWYVNPTLPSWIGVQPDSGVVSTGQIDILTVTADATSMTWGTRLDSVQIMSDDAANPTVSVYVALTVLHAADIAVSDTLLVFPDLLVGSTSTLEFTIYNVGGKQLTGQASVNNTNYVIPIPNFYIQPGQYLTKQLTYRPLTDGTHEGTVTLNSNDEDGDVLYVSVTGSATYPPNTADIAVSDTLLVFPDLMVGSANTNGITVYNVGGTQLSGGAAVSDPDFLAQPVDFTINPGDSAAIQVTFQPSTSGLLEGTVTLVSNDADGDTLYVELTGRAIHPSEVTAAPDSIVESVGPGGRRSGLITITNAAIIDSPVLFEVVFEPPPNGPNVLVTTTAHTTPDPPCEPWASAALSSSSPSAPTSVNQWHRAPVSVTDTDFFDDFEDGILLGWEDGGGSGVKTVTSESAADGTIYSYRETDAQAGHHNGIFRNLGPTRPAEVSFWIRSGSQSTFDSYFTLRDRYLREVIYFLTLNTGMFYVNGNVGGHTTFPYSAGVWYHIEFRDIDFATKTFDYAVNDSVVQADISFRNASVVVDMSRVDLYNHEAGATGWWDEILISPGPIRSWLTVSPWTGVVSAGQSSDFDVLIDATDLVHGTYQATIYSRIDVSGQRPIIGTIPVTLTVDSTIAIGIDESESPLKAFALEQNYPNPFNPTTTIVYELPLQSNVTLTVYDVTGRRVRELLSGIRPAGRHAAVWNGTDDADRPVATGVYFYRLVAGDFDRTRKMVLLK